MTSASQSKGVFSALPEILLVSATVFALIWSNSPFAEQYEGFLHLKWQLSLHHWVNDGLMVIFFFLIGLEVKKELVIGHLSTRAKLVLPLAGAVGGMLVPALIFIAFALTISDPASANIALRGWAIAAATDIAFALGVLRMAGRGVPASMRVFLSALAIADDLGAIIIIALFYSAGVNVLMLAAAAALLGISFILGKSKKLNIPVLVVLGIGVWLAVLNSGVHATVAGVALALTVPTSSDTKSMMMRLEHALKPYVDFFILPIFALCNAGIPLAGFSLELLFAPVTLGVALGLFLGKQIGVWIGGHIPMWVSKGVKMPASATARQFYGVSVLTGIGFTMSLFIAALAFPAGSEFSVEARIGVLLGSIMSVILGVIVLTFGRKKT